MLLKLSNTGDWFSLLMAIYSRSHSSFHLKLMTEMWEFVLFYWRTAALHNSSWSFKIAVILEKAKMLSFFFLIGKASFCFFSHFIFRWNTSQVLQTSSIKCCQIQYALVHLDFKALSGMNCKCPDHGCKPRQSHDECWLSWKDDQSSSVSDRESTCSYFQIGHFTCKYNL